MGKEKKIFNKNGSVFTIDLEKCDFLKEKIKKNVIF